MSVHCSLNLIGNTLNILLLIFCPNEEKGCLWILVVNIHHYVNQSIEDKRIPISHAHSRST